jgi:hypothetical protein
MPLLNYTTTVPVNRTVSQVTELLIKAGARQIMSEFAEGGTPVGVMFALQTMDGLRAFKLPVHTDRVMKVMRQDRGTPPRFKNPEQAERVAWRILKDWLEAQLAIVQTEMVSFDEVMLPYMRAVDGRTMYEMYLEGQLPALATGNPS